MDDLLDTLRYMKRLGMYQDTEYPVPFKLSGFSKMISGTLFEDCEVTFDPDYGQVIIDSRGYEVIIELGNTASWKTGSDCGGHDEALRIIVKDNREWDDDNSFKDFFVPVRESDTDVEDQD